jgi:hypothetical protein
MVYARQFWHSLNGSQFDLSNLASPFGLTIKFEITGNRIPNVIQGLIHRIALRMASREFGTAHRDAITMFEQCDVKLAIHTQSLNAHQSLRQRFCR